MNTEDALTYLIAWLRQPMPGPYPSYGYDVYLPNIIRTYLAQRGEVDQNRQADERKVRELSPAFYAAAWDLCRRGILRPGVCVMGAQATNEGAAGNGYSVTPFGRTWLAESDRDDFVPTEPGRFAQMLSPHRDRFGPAFYERAQEAVRCYGAHAYLACCAMCGAAAESILLATAIARFGQESVLSTYNSAQGRGRIEGQLLGKAREQLQREFRGYLSLLKYWRDEASHGGPANIADDEAYTSLALLLRFAKYVDQWWEELTRDGA
jgi:hypothetical protein